MTLKEIIKQRILILDGAMGTEIQQFRLSERDFRGERFRGVKGMMSGNNDMLNLTRPGVIREIHRRYLEAGADLITTNTFSSQRISQADYHLEDFAREMAFEGARIARLMADEYATEEHPRWVCGSVGPTNKTCSMSSDVSNPAARELTYDQLFEAYHEQMEALVEGGVDVILIETIFDTLNAKVAIDAAQRVMAEKDCQLPIMLSFSVATPNGYNMLGQNIVEFIEEVLMENGEAKAGCPIASIGINCVTDVAQMSPLVKELARFGTCVSFYPNAGLPDANGQYLKTPESLLRDLWPLLEGHHLNIVGGCCGTTDKHIALMAKAIEPIPGIRMSGLNHTAIHGAATPLPSREMTTPKNEEKKGLREAIISGNSSAAVSATQDAIAAGAEPQALINEQMIGAMSEIGRQFQNGKAFVPQLLMAGRAMKAALKELQPLIAGTARTSLGKVVIGTVKGDLHDIGKNLVASMLEGCGFEVVNIGIDVSADKFIEAVKEHEADILCMSALLTTTMDYMKEVISALEASGLREKVKVMVGGAPVTQGFANEIGADGYADNANSAVAVAKQLLGVRGKR